MPWAMGRAAGTTAQVPVIDNALCAGRGENDTGCCLHLRYNVLGVLVCCSLGGLGANLPDCHSAVLPTAPDSRKRLRVVDKGE